jgi:ribosome biogenesis GTPase A
VIEKMYGIVLPPPAEGAVSDVPRAEEVLQAYATVRGFMTAHGSPNESQAARIILKDYVNV